MPIAQEEVFGPGAHGGARRHARRRDRDHQPQPLRQRHVDLHRERRGGAALPPRGGGGHDRRQHRRRRAGRLLPVLAAGRTPSSATCTRTAPTRSTSSRARRRSRAAGSPRARGTARTSSSDERRGADRRLEAQVAYLYQHLGLVAGRARAPARQTRRTPSCSRLINDGKKIEAIKRYRELTGVGLPRPRTPSSELERRYRLVGLVRSLRRRASRRRAGRPRWSPRGADADGERAAERLALGQRQRRRPGTMPRSER